MRSDLECKVLKTIDDALQTKYIGGFSVEHDGNLYTLKLELNHPEAPLYFSFEGDEESFINYLTKDLQKRQLDKVKYYKCIQTDPGNNIII